MLVFKWGTVVGNGVAVTGKGVAKLTNVVLHDILEPYNKIIIYYTTMLSI